MSQFVTQTSHKSRKKALLLCVFLGIIGAHYFYVGRITRGFIAMFTLNFLFFGWLHDIKIVLLGRFKDQYGMPLIEW